MKPLVALLIILFLVLQYKLWFGGGGVIDAIRSSENVKQQKNINAKLRSKNAILLADVRALKQNRGIIEGEARSTLGMIKKGETFYQVITPSRS